MSDKIREQYKAFSHWCYDSRQRGLDPRLHQHAGPIEHGGYIADPKTATAFAAWQAALAQQPAPAAQEPAAWVKYQSPFLPIFHAQADRPWNGGKPDMAYQPLYAAPPAAEQLDHSGDSADMVWCACGDVYPEDTYDAGFIHGSGMCQNCDAAIPAKDIQADADDLVVWRITLPSGESCHFGTESMAKAWGRGSGKVERIDLKARPALELVAAEQPYTVAVPRELYTCIGKGGTYELIGKSQGAGELKHQQLVVYRSAETGLLYHRTPDDFHARMVLLAGGAE